MYYDRFDIRGDSCWVEFVRPDPRADDRERYSFETPKGRSVEDVIAAATATGWVLPHGDEWRIRHNVSCKRLAGVVIEMSTYFDAAGRPTAELLRVKDFLLRRFPGHREFASSNWIFAWIDLTVREDAADDARASSAIWKSESVVVNLQPFVERRVEEVRRRGGIALAITGGEFESSASSASLW